MTFEVAILWLALNIYHESRNQSELGQLAVAYVTLNRAEERGLTIRETVLQYKQFSWTWKLPRSKWVPEDAKAFELAMRMAALATKGHDFTRGAMYYHHASVEPYWTPSYSYIADIGVHKFYR